MLFYIYYGIIFILLIALIIVIIKYTKFIKKSNFTYEEYKNKYIDETNLQISENLKLIKQKEKYMEQLDLDIHKLSMEANGLKQMLNNLVVDIENKKEVNSNLVLEIKNKNEFNSNLLKIREEELDNLINEKRDKKELELQYEIEEWSKSAQEAATFNNKILINELKNQQNEYQQDLVKLNIEKENLIKEIDDYKEKRDIINQEILRSRAIEEQQDFYRIQLDNSSKEDIKILNNIRQKLTKTDLLNKLIYENYIARPAKEMIKRVLEGKNPSGIYKVTNIETNEIYIGKSVKTADRLLNHVKSAYGLEGVAESQFQRALKKYGIDMFTWELLEECPKENLNDAEKYYIVFFGTKEYGYNQREG